MDKTVPPGAALLLDFIGGIEAPKGYGTIYANKQSQLAKPLTEMTLDEVIGAGPGWTKKNGSSAAGRYQFMNRTLKDLKKELGLRGTQIFSADLQDRLGYHLLKRRGYEAFMDGRLSLDGFGKALAQEWASLPVLADTRGHLRDVKRGQSYYAGDGLNKSLVKPEAVTTALSQAKDAIPSIPAEPIPDLGPKPIPVEAPEPLPKSGIAGWVIFGLVILAVAAFFIIKALGGAS